MAPRKPKQKKPKTERGLTAKQYKRKQFLKMVGAGAAAISMGLVGKEAVESHVRGKKLANELRQLEKRRIERDYEHKKKLAEIQAKHTAGWEAYRKEVERRRVLAKREPKLNVKSVLLKDVPLQNRISKEIAVKELTRFKSPMATTNTVKIIYDYSTKKGIDPAYVLSISRMETRHGTASFRARRNKNPGNLKARNKKVKQDEKGFMIFGSWEQGTKAMIDRLVGKTYVGGGNTTVNTIAHIYAPVTENATNQYINNIQSVRNQLFKMQQKENASF